MANDTTRAQINNIPSKSHVIPLFTLKDIEIPGTKHFIPKGFDLGTKLS